ncbi:MAG: phosphate ABC transporter permease PstA [Thermoplasmata archaeon]|nr:phosphate ABC transporter permease PstA [Thermoplasmata archaeon]
MNKRKLTESIFKFLMIASTAVVIASLLGTMAIITVRGISALSVDMLTKTHTASFLLGRGGGGILNAIVGSVYLAIGATGLATLISIPVALYLQKDYSRGGLFARLTRLSLDVLWGTPSIVYGAFAFSIMVYIGMRTSLMAGILVLTLLELPILIRAIDEVLKMVPKELKEASYAVGSTRFETSFKVTARWALPGVITGILLAFGRAIGDAASILFTAGYSNYLPSSLADPVASLPLAVYFLYNSPFSNVQDAAYAAAFVLLLMVLCLSVSSRILAKRFSIGGGR